MKSRRICKIECEKRISKHGCEKTSWGVGLMGNVNTISVVGIVKIDIASRTADEPLI
jgi:hypothetical protein